MANNLTYTRCGDYYIPKEDLNMFMEVFKKVMEERKGDPIPSIPVPDGNEQEFYEKLKRQIQSLMLEVD